MSQKATRGVGRNELALLETARRDSLPTACDGFVNFDTVASVMLLSFCFQARTLHPRFGRPGDSKLLLANYPWNDMDGGGWCGQDPVADIGGRIAGRENVTL
ncbi:hypothetical protein TGDOM2_401540 [Toxoplasma gondii GAB2-2007-GAL-DOM2]|uniref:Uncharacterized protein n=1 Tax=Toxoplasma gondii GAB2-2007-GAL-DOM2 TaxID=1130820 RepID=A0A086JB26_TOXGO|nr:hypothetical protein TGDOM2_401540 [Toxoplasma gondii GAB2-2007-GAL-DOM2]